MSNTNTHNLTQINDKIEYLLKEKSLVLENELKMTDKVLQQFNDIQKYQSNKSEINYVCQKNNISKKYKPVMFLGILIALPLLILPTSFGSDNLNFNIVPDTNKNIMTSGYVIQNLKGDTIDLFHSWNIPQERTLYVDIVNSNVVGEDRAQIIKNVILSEESILLDNSIFHKEPLDSKSTYFLGWSGALKQAARTPTKFIIPTRFSIDESSSNGDISIILSTLESPDGYSGFTRSTVENNQILKSTITIYKVNQLSSADLETITRHEFGHAIGLIHSSDPSDLMHSVIETNYPLISNCDISAVTHLYDGNDRAKETCEI